MPNPIKGEADLVLADGRQFRLVLDFEAFVVAEQAYGRPLAQLMVDVAAGFVGAIRAMLTGALRQHHPLLGIADATEIFLADGDAVSDALERAGEASFPKPSEDKEPGKELASPAPDGKTSGSNGAASA